MKQTGVCWVVMWMVLVFLPALSFGAIPRSISYQGRLTDAMGEPVNDTVDFVFYICADSLCDRPLWMETHTGVVVANGLFAARLGSITPIPTDAFDGSSRWLSVTRDGVPASPTLRMLSSPYTFKSLYADTAIYAKYVGGTDCSECVLMFVDAVGPDSVIATSGTAFAGKVFGNATGDVFGTRGYAANKGIGGACGGLFMAADSGTGFHFGVRGEAYGKTSGLAQGVVGYGANTASGDAYGGYFATLSNGTGIHYALRAEGFGGSSSPVYGAYSTGANGSSGDVYGGYFWALSGGTGTHYGLYANSGATSSSNSYGIYSTASNSSSGRVYGGSFNASTGGTGYHTGVEAKSDAANSLVSYGVWSQATNTSSGDALGGYFRAMSSGTGNHYAISGNAWAASDADAYGSYGWAQNSSSGDAYGGFFETSSAGTGVHYGMKAEGYGASASPVHGINGSAENTSSGTAYGGIFNVPSSGTGGHYGIYSSSNGSSSSSTYGILGTAYNTSTGSVYGVHGTAINNSSGNTVGGAFLTSNSGTGGHTGVAGWGYNDDAAACTGVYGLGQNSVGTAYGGYFTAPAVGTQTGYGVYAEGATLAGYFRGTVWVQGTLDVTGDKNAAVKVDNGEYRSLSCQESPEVWFEDFGEGQLLNGRAHIELDELYLQTVTVDSKHPMKVFIQLNDESCNGTAVKRGTTGFDVIELRDGTSNASFTYRIVAKRKGYEDIRLAKVAGPTPEEIMAEGAGMRDEMEKIRTELEADNQRTMQEQQALGKRTATSED